MADAQARPRPRWYQEPLLHFLLLGGAVFALVLFKGKGDERQIVVDEVVRRRLLTAFVEDRGRPPRPDELRAVIETWIDSEVLYREGLALGLDRGDRLVRDRVISRMEALLEGVAFVAPPSEEDLQAYFERHRSRYGRPARLDLRHVYVDGHSDAARHRAAAIAEQLRSGATPQGLGDRFRAGHHLRQRTLDNLRDVFGDELISGLEDAPLGEWHLRRSASGWHVVAVESYQAAVAPQLADVRAEVLADYTSARQRAAVGAERETLRERFDVRWE